MGAVPYVEPWLAYRRPRAGARLRLFCFHHAGAGASAFRDWADELPPEFDVYPVQLPGRESRFREPPFTEMEPLVEALVRALTPHLETPFTFFGHSMGALVAFALTRELRRAGGPMPAHLFVSGRRPPQLPVPQPPLHVLPRRELLERLRELEGMHAELFEHEDLLDCLLPVIRADLTVCGTFRYTKEEPLDCPLTVFGGADDLQVEPGELAQWCQLTRGGCRLTILPGGHFFPSQQRPQLLDAIVKELLPLIFFTA